MRGRAGRILAGTMGLVFGVSCFVQAADVDEVRQKSQVIKKMLDGEEVRRQEGKRRVAVRASYLLGYESNANLDRVRKGDLFEGVSANVFAQRSLTPLSRLSLRYDFFSTVYHEITDNSYLINNLDGQWVRKFFFGHVGVGTNLAFVSYPDNAPGDFFSPRAYVFLRHKISRRVYHQGDVEISWRRYTKAKAIADALAVYQEKDRRDDQRGAAYQIGIAWSDKFSTVLKTKFLTNDSNARYQDYYDSRSYRGDLSFFYRGTPNDLFMSGVSFVRRDYVSRLTVDGTERQSADLWGAQFGWRHALTKHSVLSLSYRYLENLSNEPTAEYTDNITTLGWSYNF